MANTGTFVLAQSVICSADLNSLKQFIRVQLNEHYFTLNVNLITLIHFEFKPVVKEKIMF